jgi:hypothetical protein
VYVAEEEDVCTGVSPRRLAVVRTPASQNCWERSCTTMHGQRDKNKSTIHRHFSEGLGSASASAAAKTATKVVLDPIAGLPSNPKRSETVVELPWLRTVVRA